jgi:hypothetical protein
MEKFLLLVILLNLVHWLADYTPISTPWMLSAKRHGKPIFPIFVHGLIHAVLMTCVIGFLRAPTDIMIILFVLQLATHTIFDTLKGRLALWFPKTADNTKSPYWIIMGADQFLHQIVIAIMAYIYVADYLKF